MLRKIFTKTQIACVGVLVCMASATVQASPTFRYSVFGLDSAIGLTGFAIGYHADNGFEPAVTLGGGVVNGNLGLMGTYHFGKPDGNWQPLVYAAAASVFAGRPSRIDYLSGGVGISVGRGLFYEARMSMNCPVGAAPSIEGNKGNCFFGVHPLIFGYRF